MGEAYRARKKGQSFIMQAEFGEWHLKIIATPRQAAPRGAKRRDLPEDFPEVAGLWHAGALTACAAAERLGMSRSTFQRRAREYFAPQEGEAAVLSHIPEAVKFLAQAN